jgi:hypothetical protein
MSVFRAAASDPAHRPSIEAPHPASAVPQRHPLPPGQWVPPQRGAQDPAYTDGPTEPLGAIREAAAREIAIREAEAREAAVREFAVREAEAREAAVREAVIREAAAREAALREAALRDAALRDAARRDALLHDAEVRDADARENDARGGDAWDDERGGAARGGDARDGDTRDDKPGGDARENDPRGGDPRGGDPRGGDPRGGDPRGGEGRGGDPRGGEGRGGDAWEGEARSTELRGSDVSGSDVRDTESRKAGSKRGEASTSREDVAGDPIGHRAAAARANGRPRRRAGVVLAVLLSLLALLISGATGFLSWQTFKATVRTAAPAPQPSAMPVPVAAESRPPRPESYPVAYAKEPLRLQLDCAAALFLDLDEPRADAPEALGDLRYESRCGTRPARLSLGAGAAGGSRQASADTDAAGCDRAIRTSPLGRGLQVEVRKGTALCVLTAAAPAELVLVEIIDVGGSGTAGLRATSWRVP